MTNIPDVDKPSNPYQATSLADLITSSQLHWLEVAATSVGMNKEETSLRLFSGPVSSLSREAARELELYFARVKMNAHQGHDHEHECAVCGDAFPCNQSQCDASLARYCDGCKADLIGALSGGEAA